MKSNQVGILFSMCLAALGLFGAEARREDGVSVVTVDAKAVVGKAAPDLLVLRLKEGGEMFIDCVSMFPDDAPGRTMLIHSHNDYAQKRPFWGAYEAGADSIEADVFLVDGDLLVAHSRKGLKKENTLRRLYLEPLREVMRKNGGRARADGKPLQLLVDLKNGKAALDRLVEIIEKEGYRDCFDIVKNPSATRLTVTGDHSKIKDFLAYPDFVFFDVPPIRQLADEQYRRVPLISHYARAYTRWRSGAMKEEDKEKIRVAVRQAHAKGAKFRLWGYPDNPEAWRLARELGLDYINTDRPAAAAAFLGLRGIAPAVDVRDCGLD